MVFIVFPSKDKFLLVFPRILENFIVQIPQQGEIIDLFHGQFRNNDLRQPRINISIAGCRLGKRMLSGVIVEVKIVVFEGKLQLILKTYQIQEF